MECGLTTLCYIEKEDSYLMLHRVKKEKDANKDKWIGVGGHFEAGESPEECVKREVLEETGMTLQTYRLRGIITFCSDEWGTEYMYLFTGTTQEGRYRECEEGELAWVKKREVYDLPIWEGDKIFLRLLEEQQGFFTLKLRYQGEELVEAVQDGEKDLLL